jgi:hypothetical protein
MWAIEFEFAHNVNLLSGGFAGSWCSARSNSSWIQLKSLPPGGTDVAARDYDVIEEDDV